LERGPVAHPWLSLAKRTVCIVVRKTPDPEATGSLRDQDTDSCRRPAAARTGRRRGR
jgi:hypothetical protein